MTMPPRALLARLLALAMLLAAAAAQAPAAAADPLRFRPPGCDPANCASCLRYSVHADNITDAAGNVAEDACGSDGAFFPGAHLSAAVQPPRMA